MRSPLSGRAGLAATLLLFPLVAGSAEILLFDGSQSNRPQDQPWMTYVDNPFVSPAPAQTVVGGTGVRLDTRSNVNHSAGYFNHDFFLGFFTGLHNPDFPALNPADGFSLAFDLLIHDEDHLSGNRAGFSVILLGMDLFGIELGFWENRIWAQSGTGFTQAEGVGHATNLSLSTYELLILNTEYFLLADGFEILTGATRDYSPASPLPDPYDEQNMLFLGDNTTSASADFTLGRITLTTGPFAAAPAPLPAWLILAGVAWLVRGRPRL
jgi:hypothetical protein